MSPMLKLHVKMNECYVLNWIYIFRMVFIVCMFKQLFASYPQALLAMMDRKKNRISQEKEKIRSSFHPRKEMNARVHQENARIM